MFLSASQVGRNRQTNLLLIFVQRFAAKWALCQNKVDLKLSVPPLSKPMFPISSKACLESSLPMLEVFQSIVDAASADIPVLITGETGTGKDLVAGAIHNRSRRKDKPFIAVNTGAMPADLIASELFGHEKGAYTGAISAHKGSFELADGGTIFLDEISTMDEKCQVFLLRVLETKTFRRVGGERDIRVDVRVIGATNENLEAAIKNNRFREDLYYRFDVFRIKSTSAAGKSRAGSGFSAQHFLGQFGQYV